MELKQAMKALIKYKNYVKYSQNSFINNEQINIENKFKNHLPISATIKLDNQRINPRRRPEWQSLYSDSRGRDVQETTIVYCY